MIYQKYGRLPNLKKDQLSHRLKERKYFDSGDYALCKAGKQSALGPGGGVGSQHPTPDQIPHSQPQHIQMQPHGQQGTSPAHSHLSATFSATTPSPGAVELPTTTKVGNNGGSAGVGGAVSGAGQPR
jgi:hypothetical protein